MAGKLIAADGTKPAGMESNGVKLDAGKVRHDLLPPDALTEIARVYTFGAEKYAPRNWEKGMDWGRVYAAGQRHMMAFWGGENADPETGYLHTAHAAFAALTLTSYQLRTVGQDSRFVTAPAAPTSPRPVITRLSSSGKGVTISHDDFMLLMAETGRA